MCASNHGCKDHRECTDPHDERERVIANGEEREEASDQVNTGDDHRCTVDNRAHWCWTFHRVRKPDVHREHGRFAPATREDKDGTQDQCLGFAHCHETEVDEILLEIHEGERVDRREVEAPDDVAHEHNAEQEETIGKAGEDERLLGCTYCTWLVIPEADEQVTRNAHEFPEDEHLEKVCRDDEAEHAETEQRKQREESPCGSVFSHVADAVDVHHEADERHDHEHHHGQGVDEHADSCNQITHERDKRMVEENRLLRSEVREVDECDYSCGNKRKPVADNCKSRRRFR